MTAFKKKPDQNLKAVPSAPVSIQEIEDILSGPEFSSHLVSEGKIAVALSGGPDSMALAWLLSGWAAKTGREYVFLTVDHGLRKNSAQEAERVSGWAETHFGRASVILKWRNPAGTRLQEEARTARYDLMAAYCKSHRINGLFTAHHMDDQAETVLFRLIGGSGLDGLGGMRPVKFYGEDLKIFRPLLAFSKERLFAVCEAENLPYVEDPSNHSADFFRARIRKMFPFLEKEGLSSKRLATTARRIRRAREALELLTDKAFDGVVKLDNKRIVFNLKDLRDVPEEIFLRMVLKAIEQLGPETLYPPRMEKVEQLVEELRLPPPFRKRTLGGVVFERDDKKGEIIFTREHAQS